jgi:hypothetical protein
MFAVQSHSRSSKLIAREGRKEGPQGRLVDTCMRKTSGIGVEADRGHRDGVFEASSFLLKVLMARKYSFSLRWVSSTLSFSA